MPQKGLPMRNIREILRLRLAVGLPAREVARACHTSHPTVLAYDRRAREAGLTWPQAAAMDDTALLRLVCEPDTPSSPRRPLPDIACLIQEMRRKNVTLQLLWMEYRDLHPDGYGYTQFCQHYHEARKRVDVVLRQEHRAGEKLFTDFAGDTLPIVDPATGESTPAYLFVAALGASSYTFAHVVPTMGLPHWVQAHLLALEFLGGAPQIIVPDNTSCAVVTPDRYEPVLNGTFTEMAAHYGTVIIPARVAKPRDKAKVEAAVLLAERWILAVLRHRTFFSVAEANEQLPPLLERLNTRRFQRIDASRADLFERLDRRALLPLPVERYCFREWKKARAGIDYHIEVEKHFYSVPYQLVGEEVEVSLSATTVEVLYGNRRVASHVRSYKQGGFTTDPAHRPKSHQAHLEWTPSRMIAWGGTIGPNTAALIQRILESRPHPEMGFRSCLGIISLGKRYPPERLEAAAARALHANITTCRSLRTMLERGLDRQAPPSPAAQTERVVEHANIRGPEYYKG
jgi:transposase